MTLQAMIDDSYDAPDGVFVLAGYVASAEAWAAFSKEWEELLPLTLKGNSGRDRFKMREMAGPDLIGHVPAFFRVIERHVTMSLSAMIRIKDLRQVQTRIFVPGVEVNWDQYANPYYIAFRVLIDKFHSERRNIVEMLGDEPVDFFFDDHKAKSMILKSWDNYLEGRAENLKKYYGSAPTFEDDETFLPLQAADFWAWWVRKWYREDTPEKIQRWSFDNIELKRDRKILRMEITYGRDDLVKSLIGSIRSQLRPDQPIIDLSGLDSFRPA